MKAESKAVAGRREGLVTNGLGGFASGTVAGFLARRYHGLLVAALKPPLGRTLTARAKIEDDAAAFSFGAEPNRFLRPNRLPEV